MSDFDEQFEVEYVEEEVASSDETDLNERVNMSASNTNFSVHNASLKQSDEKGVVGGASGPRQTTKQVSFES